jgi:hypothetical protein
MAALRLLDPFGYRSHASLVRVVCPRMCPANRAVTELRKIRPLDAVANDVKRAIVALRIPASEQFARGVGLHRKRKPPRRM